MSGGHSSSSSYYYFRAPRLSLHFNDYIYGIMFVYDISLLVYFLGFLYLPAQRFAHLLHIPGLILSIINILLIRYPVHAKILSHDVTSRFIEV